MPTLFVNARLGPEQIERLKHEAKAIAGYDTVVSTGFSGSNLVEGPPEPELLSADAALGQPSVRDTVAAPNLKFIQLTSAGWDRYDTAEVKAAVRSRGGVMANASWVYAQPCAEHVLAFMLANARQLPTAVAQQVTERKWDSAAIRRESRLLRGQSVVLLGYGSIAATLVDLLAPFGAKIKAVRRNVRGDEKCRTYPLLALDELLPDADHVVNILPGGEQTKHLFDARRFNLLKPTAAFYNIGRGTTVDQSALEAALKSGRFAAAYLDVTTPEPLPPDHPLWTTPRCHITPHTAGGYTAEFDTQVHHFLNNLRRFHRGEKLVDQVI